MRPASNLNVGMGNLPNPAANILLRSPCLTIGQIALEEQGAGVRLWLEDKPGSEGLSAIFELSNLPTLFRCVMPAEIVAHTRSPNRAVLNLSDCRGFRVAVALQASGLHLQT